MRGEGREGQSPEVRRAIGFSRAVAGVREFRNPPVPAFARAEVAVARNNARDGRERAHVMRRAEPPRVTLRARAALGPRARVRVARVLDSFPKERACGRVGIRTHARARASRDVPGPWTP
jgi:hypothetical protein